MSQTRLTDEKLNDLIAKIRSPEEALDKLLSDPEVVEDLLTRHYELGNLGPGEPDSQMGYVGKLYSQFLSSIGSQDSEKFRLTDLDELVDPTGFMKSFNDDLYNAAKGPSEDGPAPQLDLVRFSKVLWLSHTSSAWTSAAKHLAFEDGTTRKALSLFENGLKEGPALLDGVKSLLSLSPRPGMKLHTSDLMIDGKMARWCQTLLGPQITSRTLPEERWQEAGRRTSQRPVMHYQISIDCGTLCLADEFRMDGYHVWRQLNPSTTGGLNSSMGRNLIFSETLHRSGAFYIPTENCGFRSLMQDGKLVAAKSFDMDLDALARIALERGVLAEDVDVWLEECSAFEVAASHNMKGRHAAVLNAISDLLPQRNMTSTVWGIHGIGREMLIELAAEGIRHVIDNPKTDLHGAAEIRKQISMLGENPRLIAETQFSAMVEEGYVDLYEIEPGDWHLYKFNAFNDDYTPFTAAMTEAMPASPPAENMAFVLSRDAIDMPERQVMDLERPVQRLAEGIELTPSSDLSL